MPKLEKLSAKLSMNRLINLATLLSLLATGPAALAEEPYQCTVFRDTIKQRQKSYEVAKKWQQWDKAANDLKSIGRMSSEMKKLGCKS
jgi:hypothetical protein